MTLADHIFESKIMLFVRRNIRYTMAIIFIIINWGKTLTALKIAYCIIYLKLLYWPQTPEKISHKAYYVELYTAPANTEILAFTLVHAGYVIFAGSVSIWIIDRYLDHRQILKRELRHLCKWNRDKFKLLDQQARILITLDEEQKFRRKSMETIKRLEAIILRYEQSALLLNPKLPKRQKLSGQDDSFKDLFSITHKTDTHRKSKAVAKKTVFNLKF